MATTTADHNTVLPDEESQNTIVPEPVEKDGVAQDSDLFEPAPDGGTRAWLAAAGSCFITFAALGLANSFGVFQEYYLTHQLAHKSPDDIAWIGSVSACIQFAAGAIGGPLFDRVGPWIFRPAAVLLVFSVMMISLCKEYWQFMLAQGILLGIVTGFLVLPSMAAVAQYFEKKRATAIGIAVSGSSVGGIVMPIALSRMLNQTSLGFGWSIRIIGFIMLPLLAFSCVAITSRLPPRKTTFFLSSAFKQPTYVMLVIGCFFMFASMFTPLFFIPSYAVTRGVNPTLASYLLAVVNASSTFGRIIPAVLADKFGKINAYAFGAIATGITIFCFSEATSTAGLIVYSIVIGFTSGTIISGAGAAFSLCPKDPREFGTYMGMGMGIGSLAILIGPPVNGALVKHYGGYFEVSMFSGALCLFGGVVVFFSKMSTPKGLFGRT